MRVCKIFATAACNSGSFLVKNGSLCANRKVCRVIGQPATTLCSLRTTEASTFYIMRHKVSVLEWLLTYDLLMRIRSRHSCVLSDRADTAAHDTNKLTKFTPSSTIANVGCMESITSADRKVSIPSILRMACALHAYTVYIKHSNTMKTLRLLLFAGTLQTKLRRYDSCMLSRTARAERAAAPEIGIPR